MPSPAFDLIVIGGGSGGIATARRAASYSGNKVCLIEANQYLGGTCVNVGCVPKKIMWHTADLATRIRQAKAYGFGIDLDSVKFDWKKLTEAREAYIRKLNGIYDRNLRKDNITIVHGRAKFLSPTDVSVNEEITLTGKNILVAVGGAAMWPENIPGYEHGITSDGFFALTEQPKKVALVGAGYIAVELAGMFHGLGSETHLFIRHNTFLRKFDDSISEYMTNEYEKEGINLHKNSQPFKKIEKDENGQILIYTEDGKEDTPYLKVDCLVWAIGRAPETSALNLEAANVKVNEQGYIIVDEYQNTSQPGVYALGDVCGHLELTPVAIAAGRKLSDRLFSTDETKYGISKLDYTNVPSVVFGHPEAGTIGLTEKEAREKYKNIKVYNTKFNPLYYSLLDEHDKVPAQYKLICQGPEERVVGMHIIGDGSAEILQGFGVAIKMGATKKDFDSCVAIHPTAAEELVTLK